MQSGCGDHLIVTGAFYTVTDLIVTGVFYTVTGTRGSEKTGVSRFIPGCAVFCLFFCFVLFCFCFVCFLFLLFLFLFVLFVVVVFFAFSSSFVFPLSDHNHYVDYFCRLWCVLGMFVLT